MGDPCTHVIFYHGYWHLVYKSFSESHWEDIDGKSVCHVNEAEKTFNLSMVK